MDLQQWGFSPELARAFEREQPDPLGTPYLAPGRVARHDRTGHLVESPAGARFARLPGHLRRDPPAVGDWVVLDTRDPPTIRAVLPRRSAIRRRGAGDAETAQVIAANVDLLFVVAGLDTPVNSRKIERYLVLAAGAGVRAAVVLNKADVAAADGALPDAALRVSAATGEGLGALRALIPPGVTAAFVGPSGVGKTSLVNALLGHDALATSDVRAADKKGRHTTTARHLLPLPEGGVLLDTPGMRELALWDADVDAAFEDVATLAARCRFRDCAHDTEPGCAVREGVPPDRLASWRKLQREAASAARRADVAEERREARAWGRMARGVQKAKRERYRD